ncbi:hypothetical protein GCM10022286_10210 [Gryllotalpicola daejeonensis]|uniref:SpoVT-AbrB domain-containing protein n=1 Tax=Gryllotalpicola daejeonensis TaxID=993087 RepID=A0ABP7ZHF5_9MICO
MRGKLVKIGNSQGFRVPKPLLEQAGLTGEVEFTVLPEGLLVSPVEEHDSGNLFIFAGKSALEELNTPEEDAAWAFLQ